MRSPDRNGPAQLSRYWSALVAGAGPDELAALAAALDPEMVVTIDRMRAARHDLRPDPTFVLHLEDHLMHAYGLTVPSAALQRPLRPGTLDDRRRLVRPFATKPQRAWPMLAAAALLLAVLAGIAGTRLIDRSNPDRSTGAIPAAFVPATPSPAAGSDETVLEWTIPAELVPARNAASVALAANRLEPGRSGTWEPICCSGPMIEYVVSGVYTVRAQSEITVIRAGGAEETVAAGAEVRLTPGDAVVTDITTVMESANAGTETVNLMSVFLASDPGHAFSGKTFNGWEQDGESLPNEPFGLEGPLTVQLRLVSLESDVVIEPPDGAIQLSMVAPGETGSIARDMGAVSNTSEDGSPVEVYVLTIEPTTGTVATPAP